MGTNGASRPFEGQVVDRIEMDSCGKNINEGSDNDDHQLLNEVAATSTNA